MPNFFVDPSGITDGEVRISDDDARHIARSLRMAEGDSITVSDGKGMQYRAVLTKIRDEQCLAKIEDCREGYGEGPVKITLFMGYPKSDKLELIVQKATELGVHAVVPFESSRCIKRPKAEKAEKTAQRLSRIAKEAAKQCCRSVIPEISDAISFSELVRRVSDYDLSLFCYEGAGAGSSCRRVLDGITEAPRTLAVIVGCEGGFSPEEAALIEGAGATAVSLGERILRCETAPDFILSLLAYRFEL